MNNMLQMNSAGLEFGILIIIIITYNIYRMTPYLLTGGVPLSIQSFIKPTLATRSMTQAARGFNDGYA